MPCVRVEVRRYREMTPGEPLRVRAATRADVPALAAVLSRAFFDESQFVWLQPDNDHRANLLPAMFRMELQHVHPVDRGGQVLLDDGGLLGGSVWAPPGRWKASTWRQLPGIPRLILSLGKENLQSFAKRGKALQDALEKAHPNEPHWYLAALGVDPGAQGKGAGAALMRAGLDRCDGEGAPAYLECLERLVPYYERYGFEVRGPIQMPDGAPMQVGMWRPAGTR
jgi:GNAT superfamily N-acetyltransferase